MTGEDLESLGRAADVGRDDVEQDVRHDTPVEVEGHLANKQQGEGGVDVGVCQEHSQGEEEGAEDDSNATDERVGPGEPGLQTGGEDHAQRNTHYSGHHRDDTEDKLNIIHVNLSVLRLLRKEAFLDEVWTKPGHRTQAECDTGETQGREEEALVLGEADDVLLKQQTRSL